MLFVPRARAPSDVRPVGTKQGPNLHGIFGRTSGTVDGFAYTAANKNAAIEWGEDTLYDYLLYVTRLRLIASDTSKIAPVLHPSIVT